MAHAGHQEAASPDHETPRLSRDPGGQVGPQQVGQVAPSLITCSVIPASPTDSSTQYEKMRC